MRLSEDQAELKSAYPPSNSLGDINEATSPEFNFVIEVNSPTHSKSQLFETSKPIVAEHSTVVSLNESRCVCAKYFPGHEDNRIFSSYST